MESWVGISGETDYMNKACGVSNTGEPLLTYIFSLKQGKVRQGPAMRFRMALNLGPFASVFQVLGYGDCATNLTWY